MLHLLFSKLKQYSLTWRNKTRSRGGRVDMSTILFWFWNFWSKRSNLASLIVFFVDPQIAQINFRIAVNISRVSYHVLLSDVKGFWNFTFFSNTPKHFFYLFWTRNSLNHCQWWHGSQFKDQFKVNLT